VCIVHGSIEKKICSHSQPIHVKCFRCIWSKHQTT
jgi:hypothetical protein